MTPEELSDALHQILTAAAQAGDLAIDADTITAPRVERPKNRDHGDWSTNVALQLAKKAGMNPRDLAEKVAAQLKAVEGVAAVDIAGPGFLNITLDAASAGNLAKAIVEAGESFGRTQTEAGRVVNLEFISANPTGPLHIGHTRWAALGDAMRRLLAAAGATVTAEYYINDAGAQMNKYGASVLARAKGQEPPEDGYPGADVALRAKDVLAQRPDLLDLPDDEAVVIARDLGYQAQLAAIRETLENFGVHFDVWFSEKSLHEGGAVEHAIDRLREQGHIFESEGAIWLRTTTFGDDKDRVLIRANGEPTYFASDAAYYINKRERGFDEKIYLLGADHHGYIGRLKAIAACAGDDPEHNIEVKIGQLVDIGGERMGKRRGNAIYLDDLLEWIGSDAVRYSLARYPADSPLSLDGEDMRKRSNENPVFYVQYAHARTCSVTRLANEEGVRREDGFDPSLLTHSTESALLATLGDYPRIVAQSARLMEPHRIARYLEDLAAKYHKWYDECRVRPTVTDDVKEAVSDLHRTRLWLNDATRQVLANGLDLLGVTAPERL